jgi:ABC-type dipeptide/oligopeptide/nickel transport system permease component
MTFIGALLYVGANILGDVLYARVDPRVRVS